MYVATKGGEAAINRNQITTAFFQFHMNLLDRRRAIMLDQGRQDRDAGLRDA